MCTSALQNSYLFFQDCVAGVGLKKRGGGEEEEENNILYILVPKCTIQE